MSWINTGGPAFPGFLIVTDSGLVSSDDAGEGGMTLRDYFAAKAMQGMTGEPWPNGDEIQQIARRAYMQADAMIAAREEGQ